MLTPEALVSQYWLNAKDCGASTTLTRVALAGLGVVRYPAGMQTILFDMGNVLVRYDADRRMGQLGELTGLGRAGAEKLLAGDDWHIRYEKGRLTTPAFATRFIEARQANAPARPPCTVADVMRAFTDVFSPLDAMPSLLATLKRLGFRLVVVSNTNETDIATVQRLYPTLMNPFDHLVLSHEIDAYKPEPEFYAHALKQAKAPAEKCVFVDDLVVNIEGARKAGMHGVVFTTPEACKLELERLLGRTL